MTRKLPEVRVVGHIPRGHVADHWTWRDGVPHVTGTHPKPKRGQQQIEPGSAPATGRGSLRELASPKPVSRSKELRDRQGKLL